MKNYKRLEFLKEGITGGDSGQDAWEYSDMDELTKSFLNKNNELEIFMWHFYDDDQNLSTYEWLSTYYDVDFEGVIRVYATDLIEYNLHYHNYETCTMVYDHAIKLINNLK